MPHRVFMEAEYLIVNPMQVDACEWKQLESISIAPRRLKHEAHMLPRLVAIQDLKREHKVELLDRNELALKNGGNALWSCALKSGASFESTAAHLAKVQVLKTPHGQHFLLRCHDPRVFRHLIWILEPHQLALLMGPIEIWSWMDSDTLRWYQTPRPSDVLGGRLTGREWGGINRIGLLNATLRDLQRIRADVALDQVLFRQIDAALEQAIEVEGLSDSEDQCLYAQHCIFHGDAWSSRPDVKAVLQRVRNGESSYYSLSSECTSSGAQSAFEHMEGNRHA